jgi:hypothetical protein
LTRYAALLVLALSACAPSTGDPKIAAHGGERARFRTGPLPSGWRRVRSDADVGYFNESLGAVIMANADCRRRDVPPAVLGNSLLVGFTDRHLVREQRILVDDHEALRRIHSAKLNDVPFVIETLVLQKDGCSYDLVYAAPPAQYDAGHRAFGRFVAGFATLPPRL